MIVFILNASTSVKVAELTSGHSLQPTIWFKQIMFVLALKFGYCSVKYTINMLAIKRVSEAK